jgi:thioredoxin 1
MKRTQVIALLGVVLLIGAVVGLKISKTRSIGSQTTVANGATCPTFPTTGDAVAPSAAAPVTHAPTSGLPLLLDLGSTTCIPCKELAPILDQLTVELRGKVDIKFIDVTKQPQAADTYAINVIPTQIFFDAQGKELFRHEGFIPKADILAKLHELKMLSKE